VHTEVNAHGWMLEAVAIILPSAMTSLITVAVKEEARPL
jgi:hypothetical protein